jgi:hypothetical protein
MSHSVKTACFKESGLLGKVRGLLLLKCNIKTNFSTFVCSSLFCCVASNIHSRHNSTAQRALQSLDLLGSEDVIRGKVCVTMFLARQYKYLRAAV